jgi:hypothetical protein
MSLYQVSAVSMKIVRDQRLGLINLEGALELTARFSCAAAPGSAGQVVTFPEQGWVTGKQGDTIDINKNIVVTGAGSVVVKVDITELEPKGMAGEPDTGTADVQLIFNNQPRVEKKVQITTTADSATEKSAILEVTLVAVRL